MPDRVRPARSHRRTQLVRTVAAVVVSVLVVLGGDGWSGHRDRGTDTLGTDTLGSVAPPATAPPHPTPIRTGHPAAATTLPAPMSMRRSTPTRLVIPAIGVDSGLVGLGIQPDGSLEVPSTGFPAGWFTGAPTPGELGPAVIAGHVHWQGRWGVFRRLGTLERGDTVTIDRADGSVAVFRVTRTEQVSKDAFPTKQVYGLSSTPGCGSSPVVGSTSSRGRTRPTSSSSPT